MFKLLATRALAAVPIIRLMVGRKGSTSCL